MNTVDYALTASHSDIMREAHRNGWHILRGKWVKDQWGEPVFRLYFVEGGK